MTLNLDRHNLPLQALHDGFALCDRQTHGGWRDQVLAFEGDDLSFNERSRLWFGNKLHCPFHAARLRHPTTLHALEEARWRPQTQASRPY